MTKNPSSDATLPKGIHRSWKLPDKSLGDLWDSIVMDEAIKKQLLSQAIVNFTVRPKVERTVLPLHGVILLVGPPGTGTVSYTHLDVYKRQASTHAQPSARTSSASVASLSRTSVSSTAVSVR